jgi:ubiquinone/menaquinone biosynthesis C-methylase UbiE
MVALDVGGGPGAHAAQWASAGARAIVVDPSSDMNQLALAEHPGLPVVRARAESLPFRTGCAALVYFHLSIHHTSWRVALAEATRVVRPNGTVAVMTLGPAHHDSSMLQRWFPRVAVLDRGRFPDPADLVAELSRAGADVAVERVVQTKRRRTGDWVAAVEARFVSTLQMLDDEEIEMGLAAMAARHPDADAQLAYPMVWEEITARF